MGGSRHCLETLGGCFVYISIIALFSGNGVKCASLLCQLFVGKRGYHIEVDYGIKMGAKKGNTNGKATWIDQLTDESLIQLAVRVPRSQVLVIDDLLKPGQLRSDWLREAIAEKLKADDAAN